MLLCSVGPFALSAPSDCGWQTIARVIKPLFSARDGDPSHQYIAVCVRRFQDVLPSDSDDSSSSEDETDKAKDPEPSAAKKKPGPAIQKKDLEQLGFKGGPSILYVPEPAGTEQQSWGW